LSAILAENRPKFREKGENKTKTGKSRVKFSELELNGIEFKYQ